jgi:peptide-methionine (S)-S-oxide reductase
MPWNLRAATIALVLAPVLGAFSLMQARSEPAATVDPPKIDIHASGDKLQTAVLAGGCFWGIQAVFQHTKGVTQAVSGYAGGDAKDAQYETVSSGRTGHAESVQITFDPQVISYGKILQIFFSVAHNPTEIDRQGPDTGPQYRSEIFPRNEQQRAVAAAYIAQLDAAKVFPSKIATRVDAGTATFFPAEAYHQDFAVKHPNHPYIFYHDAPKVKNLKQAYPAVFREQPVTVASSS